MGEQNDSSLLYLYVFRREKALMKDGDKSWEGTERVSANLLLIEYLPICRNTTLRSTFLLLQFLILFHSIIQCEKVEMSTSFVPIWGPSSDTLSIFLFSLTYTFSVFISA